MLRRCEILWGAGVLAALGGCGPREITVTGRWMTAFGATEGLAGGEVTLLDGSTAPYADTTTGEGGAFDVIAPVQSRIFLSFSGAGSTPITFAGTSGVADPFPVPDGQLFAMPTAEEASWRQAFAGCPRVDEPGWVLGEVRVGISFDPTLDPLDPSAQVYVELDDGTRLDACYVDSDSGAYAPDQATTGLSGQFAVFGVPAGLHTVVAYRDLGGGSVRSEWPALMVDGGAVVMRSAFLPL
jgi:hypothetical protein